MEPIRIVHIAGTMRSGKTTVFLNCRNAHGVLYSERRIDKVGGIVFAGGGLGVKTYKRLTGTDLVARKQEELSKKIGSLVDAMSEYRYDKNVARTVLIDSYLQLDNQITGKVETVVRLCYVTKDMIAERRPSKPIRHYLDYQEELIESLRMADVDLKIWSPKVSLGERVDETLKLLGSPRPGMAVIQDFKQHWKEQQCRT